MTAPQDNTPKAAATDGQAFACHAARVMADNHCENVIVIQLKGISQVTDFFVIGTGTSDRQLHAVATDLKLLAKEEGQSIFRSHGTQSGAWVVMDFVDVVAHLFSETERSYYDLESLWGDAERLDWQSATKPGQFAHLRTKPASSLDA